MRQMELAEQVARDEALATVTENAGDKFVSDVLGVLRSLPQARFKIEDLRAACANIGVLPHHHNVWGGLAMRLLKANVIRDTGERAPMTSKGSHYRKTTVYERT